MLGAMTSDLPPDAQTAPYDPRTADRSPSGTGLAARLAGEVTLAGSVIEVTGVETGAATKACGVSNTADATNRRISFPPLCRASYGSTRPSASVDVGTDGGRALDDGAGGPHRVGWVRSGSSSQRYAHLETVPCWRRWTPVQPDSAATATKHPRGNAPGRRVRPGPSPVPHLFGGRSRRPHAGYLGGVAFAACRAP